MGTEAFVAAFGVPWPCGYGAELATIAQFGAYNPAVPKHEVWPMIYLTDGFGNVLWHDEQARPRHTKKSAGLVKELVEEIEAALNRTPEPVVMP